MLRTALLLVVVSFASHILCGQAVESKKKAGKWGFVVGKQVVIDYQYDQVRDISYNPDFLVEKDAKWGVVSGDGREVVPCVYDSIGVAQNRWFVVAMEDKLGVLDSYYRVVVPITCAKIDHITETYALVQIDGDWGHLFNGQLDKMPERMVFHKPERRALFKSCLHVSDPDEMNDCAEMQLLSHVYTNTRYPAAAREGGIQGRVIVEFLVSPEGLVVEPAIVRDIGGGCGEELLRVVNSFPEFIPAQQDGNTVWSRVILPVQFKLGRIR